MNAPTADQLILRVPEQGTELRLREGVQSIVRDANGVHASVDGHAATVRFCVDRRGVWLTVPEGAGSVHVNGRRVQRMAMLRAGDAIYIDGTELVLSRSGQVEEPDPSAYDGADGTAGDLRVILRGVGGKHHGRSFTLERPRLVGSASDADIRIDDPVFAERHAQLSVLGERIVLRDLGSADGSLVNGQAVRDAWLQPGDQLVFDALHRFVVEAPGKLRTREPPLPDIAAADDPVVPAAQGWRRWPWLLLAAVLIAGVLAALLMFGSAL